MGVFEAKNIIGMCNKNHRNNRHLIIDNIEKAMKILLIYKIYLYMHPIFEKLIEC